MPEGDTVHKVAAVLRRELVGRRVARLELDGRRFPLLEGGEIASVEAVGKHLLVAVDGLLLRTHLGMHGSWHRYPPQERWQRPRWQASMALWTGEQVVVCFNAREVECLDAANRDRHPVLSRLGPDLIVEELDEEETVTRARRLGDEQAPIVDLLLDQRVAAGIGNVYKSELLYLHRLHPTRRLAKVSDRQIVDLYATAQSLLRNNLHGGERTTTTENGLPPLRGPRLWVYGRHRRPCLCCSTPIRHRRMGRGLRSTYWCPTCQPAVP